MPNELSAPLPCVSRAQPHPAHPSFLASCSGHDLTMGVLGGENPRSYTTHVVCGLRVICPKQNTILSPQPGCICKSRQASVGKAANKRIPDPVPTLDRRYLGIQNPITFNPVKHGLWLHKEQKHHSIIAVSLLGSS